MIEHDCGTEGAVFQVRSCVQGGWVTLGLGLP